GYPVQCDDGISCTDDICNESTDSCGYTPDNSECDDGAFCNGAETCHATQGCQGGSDPCSGESCDEGGDTCASCLVDGDCDDGQHCNGQETCSGGNCQAGTAVSCNDGVACTDDSCNEGTDSCDNTPNNGGCDDGAYCNGSETCHATQGCQSGSDPCSGEECNESTDSCVDCLDNGDCDDGVFCNGSETCSGGSCQAGSDPCSGQTCVEASDSCIDCTVDGDCDDGLFCNGDETCSGGSCQAGSDPCGGQACIESTDTCSSGPAAKYSWNMDTDPGWTTDGEWAFGQPTGSGGSDGNPDPSAGFTGSNVYGYNLSGDYGEDIPEEHLTTTAINCTGLTEVTLKFQRWLGVEKGQYDDAFLKVSNDGTNWTTLFQNESSTNMDGGAWEAMEYDISAVANDQATVYIRWTMGASDGGVEFCGWNIDDVEIFASGGCAVDADCNNGDFCDGVETCSNDICQAGSNPCPGQACDEGNDQCLAEACYYDEDSDGDNDVMWEDGTSPPVCWRRCLLPQEWDGTQCTGSASDYSRNTAVPACEAEGDYHLVLLEDFQRILDPCSESGNDHYCDACDETT
ncbi:MAG: hypothetical protein GY835_19120, partial [bacterium]|nr:hypothetical protein [bacterium]